MSEVDVSDPGDVSLSENEEAPASPPRPVVPPARPLEDAVPSHWTVKKPGKCQIPTSNDYNKWTVEQLRKECTARKKHIPRGCVNEKDARVSALQESDVDRDLAVAAVDPVAWRLRKADHTTIRLLNVLFAEKFVKRLPRIDDAPTRLQVETRDIAGNAEFWKDVHEEYSTNFRDYNGLYIKDDPRYTEVAPWTMTTHKPAELYAIYQSLLPLYKEAFRCSTVSGQHSSDFLRYCNGRLDINYLHVCCEMSGTEVAKAVRGGMPVATRLDSTKPIPARQRKNKRSRDTDTETTEQNDLVSTLKQLTSHLVTRNDIVQTKTPDPRLGSTGRSLSDLLDCIAKSYSILNQLQTALKEQGGKNTMLSKSIALQEAGIRQLESDYAVAMGMPRPDKQPGHCAAAEDEFEIAV